MGFRWNEGTVEEFHGEQRVGTMQIQYSCVKYIFFH